jgi:hypothetical protein
MTLTLYTYLRSCHVSKHHDTIPARLPLCATPLRSHGPDAEALPRTAGEVHHSRRWADTPARDPP